MSKTSASAFHANRRFSSNAAIPEVRLPGGVDPFIYIGPVPVDRSQMEGWRDGSLGKEWDQRYKDELPLFFDTAGDWF